MKRLLLTLLVSLPLVTAAQTSGSNIAEAVCGPIQEPAMFFVWRHAAGKSQETILPKNVESIEFLARDGTLLKGFKASATSEFKGTVLVAQGNAMLAEQLISPISYLAASGLDVYIFDYRGYGRSGGDSRLKAIIEDYRELEKFVISSGKAPYMLYAFSFGGIVVLNATSENDAFDRFVIDSVPSRISIHGCPPSYDPVNNLPKKSAKVLFIAGSKDKVVTQKMSEELLALGAASGAVVVNKEEFAHPFMDSSREIARERMDLVRSFLAQ